MSPAFIDVGTTRLFTYRMQSLSAHELFEALVVFASGSLHPEPGRTPLWNDGCHNLFPLPEDLIHVDFGAIALQFCTYRLQKTACSRAIEQAMVEGETEIHHVTDSNGIVLSDHWPLHHRIHTQNAGIGLVNNGHRYDCAEDTGIVHDKGATLHILEGELIGAGTLSKIVHAFCQARQRVLIRIMNDWYNQANIGSDSDSQV